MSAAPSADPSCWFDPFEDRLREECGVFGVFGAEDAALLTALGLHALQHRGQEACGITSYDGGRFYNERHLGLVGDNFSGPDVPHRLPGFAAIGHNRYSTQGAPVLRNVQPLFADLSSGGMSIAHNGNLTNSRILREQLVQAGAIFQSTSDTEVVIQLVARSRQTRIVDRFTDALHQIEGAFALVCLTNKKLIGARDPLGIRPLVLGRLGSAYILASETCALSMIGAQFVRDIKAGEIVVITEAGIESIMYAPERRPRPCVFEFVYFARPDSIVDGRPVYQVRKNMGRILAEECPAIADVVVPVPDSGVPAALGFAEASHIPFEHGIVRNHYVGRTFIQPSQQIRDMGVRLKHSANRAQLEGKRVVLIDDSIVRGTTSRKIVSMVREAGATEVHFRSASPMIKWPDYYGIDTPLRDKLIAATHSLEEIRQELGADSLGFLSVDGLYRAMGEERRNPDQAQFTDHCFTGEYPTQLSDSNRQLSDKDQQLSFLNEVA